jgi:hypothetical protein
MAINAMAAVTNGSCLIGLAGRSGAADTKVVTGVPHFWQKRAFSSSLVPHLRQ